jgi:putative transposase
MLAAALEAEVDAYLTAHAAEGDEGGRRLVVGNGHARQRGVLTAAGVIPVRAPRVDDRRVDPVTGERVRFRSVILPPWCRKRPKVAEVLALLYLHGLSTGDFAPALAGFFGSAAGLSAAASVGCLAPGRPTTKPSASVTWPGGTRWTCGPMGSTSGSVWSRPPVLAGAGGRARRRHQGAGRGRRRGTRVDRVVGGAAGGSASPRDASPGGGGRRRRAGLWAALRDVLPATRQQRDWVHKLANVLNALPKAVQAGARKALAEIRDAPDRDHAERAIELFAGDDGVKWPKAVARSPTTPKRCSRSPISRPNTGCP